MKLRDLLKEMARYIGEHSDPRFQPKKVKPHRALVTSANALAITEVQHVETVQQPFQFAETLHARSRIRCVVHPDCTTHDLSQCFTFRKRSQGEPS